MVRRQFGEEKWAGTHACIDGKFRAKLFVVDVGGERTLVVITRRFWTTAVTARVRVKLGDIERQLGYHWVQLIQRGWGASVVFGRRVSVNNLWGFIQEAHCFLDCAAFALESS